MSIGFKMVTNGNVPSTGETPGTIFFEQTTDNTKFNLYNTNSAGVPIPLSASNTNLRILDSDDTINDNDDIIANNTQDIELTIHADTKAFTVGRSLGSTHDVLLKPSTGFTVNGNADGVILNQPEGQIRVMLNGTDFIVSTFSSNASGSLLTPITY